MVKHIVLELCEDFICLIRNEKCISLDLKFDSKIKDCISKQVILKLLKR